jgi:hypothetical protein
MAGRKYREALRGTQNGVRLETRGGVEEFVVGKRHNARRMIRRIANPEGRGNSNVIFDSQAPSMGEKSE